MKKLFQISAKDFFTGISSNAYGVLGGVFRSCNGLWPYINPVQGSAAGSEFMGLLAEPDAPTDLTGSVVLDAIKAFALYTSAANTSKLFGLGDAGHFYQINLVGTIGASSVTDLRSATPITTPSNGLVLYKGNAYYLQTTQVGQWNLAGTYPTGWTDNWATGLQDYAYHPTHIFLDAVWICDKDRISKISGATPSLTTNVLDFPSDWRAVAVNDDGKYLVIGITGNLGDINFGAGLNKILFWDTWSGSWSREWPILEATILSIVRRGDWLFAICPKGVYQFNFFNSPKKILSLRSTEVPNYGDCWAADLLLGNALIWAGNANINTYGAPVEGYPDAHFVPFISSAGDPTAICANARYPYIFYGTASNKLYVQDITAAETVASGNYKALFNFVELGDKYRVRKIKVIFGHKLATNDEMDVYYTTDSSVSIALFGSRITFANNGAVNRAAVYKSVDAELLQVRLDFNAGAIKVRRIEAWGDRIKDSDK